MAAPPPKDEGERETKNHEAEGLHPGCVPSLLPEVTLALGPEKPLAALKSRPTPISGRHKFRLNEESIFLKRPRNTKPRKWVLSSTCHHV